MFDLHASQRGYLLVLDWAGNVLSQRKVGGQSVAVVGNKDHPPVIVTSEYNGLRRFRYDEKASASQGFKVKPW